VRNIDVFIANGSDTNAYRDIGVDVISRLRQLLQYEMNYDVTISNWDYRAATPRVIQKGTLAATSLMNVDRSQAMIGIFGRRVPGITTKEIRRAFERRLAGDEFEIFVFANPKLVTDEHDVFFQEIVNTFGEEIDYGQYRNRLEFQALLYTTLIRYLIERLKISNPALLPGGAS
jgi:hypothetical protein